MLKRVRKIFTIWQFEEEEKWLNKMAESGWTLKSVGFCRYDFERTEPAEYSVRLELLENLPSTPEGEDYIAFVESTGAEQVGAYIRWCYFRKKREQGGFDLFSDLESRIEHVKRIIRFASLLFIAELCIGMGNNVIGIASDSLVNSVCGMILSAVALGFAIAIKKLTDCKNHLESERELFER